MDVEGAPVCYFCVVGSSFWDRFGGVGRGMEVMAWRLREGWHGWSGVATCGSWVKGIVQGFKRAQLLGAVG